ncbi:MAG: carboxy terminal-processing peptidase [Bacteroidia bacterium]|nr:carboxy terminal-processing peptidase [Bacteroidia bacterium]
MKRKLLLFSSAILSFFLFSSYVLYVHEGDKGEWLIRTMMQSMEYYHYKPLEVDDRFSQMVFDEYLKYIDYNKRFLTQSDVNTLNGYRNSLDDEIQAGTFEFFTASAGIIDARTKSVQGFVSEILAKPFDFTRPETAVLDPDKTEFAADEAALRERWHQLLKYQTLVRLDQYLSQQERKAKEDPKAETKSFGQLEADARARVLRDQEAYFRRLTRKDLNDRRSEYMNSIAAVYDPHTNYFPPQDKEDFDIQMSGQLEGIGAQLQEDEGKIKVMSIVPGSASARQGQLQVNDLILQVAQGKEEPVDVTNMDLDDAVRLIRGPKGTEVRLTVRKLDGTELMIAITRDIVELEETYARSALLRNTQTKKGIGYIHLPKFYADFNHRNGRRCATDVAKEIEKLKREGVDGIILDLRDNGGGSLQDVVDMTGLFIEAGPIVQVKSREGAPQVLSDRDPSVKYDGPLVVLVNSFSASASEIMAAAIQDYGRGVIIGSPSTFGKGTVQRFVNLDDVVRGYSEVKPLGEVKLTTQKFYRINGGATQLKGVVPDIIIPDEYSLLQVGEKDQDHTMAWDEISPVPYRPWEQSVTKQLDRLRDNSAKRVAASQSFRMIQENAELIKRRQEQDTYPLNLDAYRADRRSQDAENERYKNIRTPIAGFTAATLQDDLASVSADTVRSQRAKTWHENIVKDPYIYEAMMVLNDFR